MVRHNRRAGMTSMKRHMAWVRSHKRGGCVGNGSCYSGSGMSGAGRRRRGVHRRRRKRAGRGILGDLIGGIPLIGGIAKPLAQALI